MEFYDQVQAISKSTLESAKQNNFTGYDPFDSLNSNLFKLFPSLKKGIFGLAWIQFNKRSIINIRPLLGVPKKRNPKGVALFLMGLLEDYQHKNDDNYLNQALELGDWLLTQQSDRDVWKHACWGYHFDWKARAFFVPKGKPNVITTIYVAQALYALSKITGENKYREPALDSANFIVKNLYTELEGRRYFAYIPGEDAFVHNASLWGAAWVAHVASLTNNDTYRNLAVEVAHQSVKEQLPNGSWVYGARHHHQFIDGFHTGYNLEALHLLSESLQIRDFSEAINKGLKYYKEHLFEADGTAKYYNTNKYPLDMHCVSQAIFTLIKVGQSDEDLSFTKKVVKKSIENLYIPEKKHFAYQKHHHFSNNINYIRWTQAWVYYSFSFLNNYGSSHEKD
ncbi:Highly conserved protein containing a thioredoxin domain [Vibrio sp. B1REV9]|uniref:aspartate-semialdehyde dehydrogenase n=1 Tax=Vibrio sp. B1REV9 TaxID=2751179 RepID=UPI001AF0CBCD|nr:aspartate-semialdehyde dehydrogenase [Vibrio sp. B1REV9]CAE6928152.1 Highly conserved protein containing a thioredoxin domain [Vibrio sp. B1REV9]